MRETQYALCVVVLLSFLVGFYYYPYLPSQVATHYNLQGVPDGFSPKPFGVFFFPIIILCVSLLLTILPELDSPFKSNLMSFIGYYDLVCIALAAFFLVLYFQLLQPNLGIATNLSVTLPAGLGVVAYCAGLMMEHSKRNWFAGARTPWTLSSDAVWEKTNVFAGRSFQLIGVADVVIAFFTQKALVFVIASIVAAGLGSIVYSYFQYTKLNKPNPVSERSIVRRRAKRKARRR